MTNNQKPAGLTEEQKREVESTLSKQLARVMNDGFRKQALRHFTDADAVGRLALSPKERKKLASYAADKGVTELEAVRDLVLKALFGK